MIQKLISIFILLVFLFMQGCSSVTAPVLRHETGETNGAGKWRVSGEYGAARMYPLVGTNSLAYGVTQDSSVLSGSSLGFGATYGVLPKLDMQLKGYYQVNGSGWKVAAKYLVIAKGKLQASGMLGYARYTGRGTVNYQAGTSTGTSTSTSTTTSTGSTRNADGTLDVEQVMSTRVIDIWVPVSFRFSKDFAVYSGAGVILSSVSGVAETTYVAADTMDYGFNLGMRFGWGKFEVDVEAAMINAEIPMMGSSAFNLFYGVAGGLSF